jgi:hypothetical protein
MVLRYINIQILCCLLVLPHSGRADNSVITLSLQTVNVLAKSAAGISYFKSTFYSTAVFKFFNRTHLCICTDVRSITAWTWVRDLSSLCCVFVGRSLYNCPKKAKATPRRRLWGEEIFLLLILDLGIRWVLVVSVTPRPYFSPGERIPRYALYRRLDGAQSRSGQRGYRKNPLASSGDPNWIEPRSSSR